MTDQRPRLAFLGLPRTGKSTFIGAFWALVESPEETGVEINDVTGDRSYLDFLRDQVARGEEIQRTDTNADEELRLELNFPGQGAADLLIPDTSGESLRVLVENRHWHARLLGVCREATGVLVFVHPDKLRVPMPISVLPKTTEAKKQAPAEPSQDAVPFDIKEHASTAAELIDVFENVTELLNDRWPTRFGIVISAWDRAEEATPDEWMKKRLPALLAVVETNPDIAELEVFGVSAQGGSLNCRDELLAKGEISDRVFAKDRSGNDISLIEPVRWAIWGA